jgi:hypothetical protein
MQFWYFLSFGLNAQNGFQESCRVFRNQGEFARLVSDPDVRGLWRYGQALNAGDFIMAGSQSGQVILS